MGPSNDQHRPANPGSMAGRPHVAADQPERKPYMLLSDLALRAEYLRIEAELRGPSSPARREVLVRDWGIVCAEVNFRGLDVPGSDTAAPIEATPERHLRTVE